MKTLEDGWYVVINAYKFTVFEIWRDIFASVLSYIACPCYPYIRVYRLYDTHEYNIFCLVGVCSTLRSRLLPDMWLDSMKLRQRLAPAVRIRTRVRMHALCAGETGYIRIRQVPGWINRIRRA